MAVSLQQYPSEKYSKPMHSTVNANVRQPAPSKVATWESFALLAYLAVMVSLVLLKGFFTIGGLWVPANQFQQGYSLVLFREILQGSSPELVLFSYGGNIVLFVPFACLLANFIARSQPYWAKGAIVLLVTILGLGLSVVFEFLQYRFALGFSDIDDVLMNSIGALIGGILEVMAPRALGKLWSALVLVGCVIFGYLVVTF